MLKIKDNVDLKELEKFDFEYREEDDEDSKWHYWCPKINSGISIDVVNELNPELVRIIDDGHFGFDKTDLDIIYDLIKADLVEKVEE
jgi:hypothetical protein